MLTEQAQIQSDDWRASQGMALTQGALNRVPGCSQISPSRSSALVASVGSPAHAIPSRGQNNWKSRAK